MIAITLSIFDMKRRSMEDNKTQIKLDPKPLFMLMTDRLVRVRRIYERIYAIMTFIKGVILSEEFTLYETSCQKGGFL